MELFFLFLLFLVMLGALGAGFPVAFALPGSAILTILLAGITGALIAGDPGAYFVRDGPIEWLTAGVINFRGIYWEVERDTLIAIPLFIFMGIMLQRSKVAEDLLVTMAQLFGPVPGGLGISVVFVGALLAATTGIVGATVVAMGLISLPAMLRNNYSKSLASGTICASGTLGQIIPPSIVLIILADQLSNATDQAANERLALYREVTGEFTLPSELGIVSASAGDMFLGAILPGTLLIILYMAYIFISAILKPENAPAVPLKGKAFTRAFFIKVILALIPPLLMIFTVLGSILAGIATVNQAGAIGAIGATMMASYRLTEGKRGAFYPILIMAAALAVLAALIAAGVNLKILTITSNEIPGLITALIAVAALIIAVIWALARCYKIDNTLNHVMLETAKTTSMVFIILLGAAMLTAAFRAFGGEEIVKHGLGSLPGGFWTQFVVVMFVIFLLGFFLDFIEIAVVVVPIIAPILLADPSANVTAVWLGVMVGLNIQTSFLTPPFGFALFYLRGVANKTVETLAIYKGVVPFIILQLIGLAIVGTYPQLVNYLPTHSYLTGANSPPPKNPRLQVCLQQHIFAEYAAGGKESIQQAADKIKIKAADAQLPASDKERLENSLSAIPLIFAAVDEIKTIHAQQTALKETFTPLHTEVRNIERRIQRLETRLDDIRKKRQRTFNNSARADLDAESRAINEQIAALDDRIPSDWESKSSEWRKTENALRKATRDYNRMAGEAYTGIVASIQAVRPANPAMADELAAFELMLRDNIGIREQSRLAPDLARLISPCVAQHRDLSLSF